jgi:sugar phosphate isomerase/epimerase
MTSRRQLLASIGAIAADRIIAAAPLKFGHRQANMEVAPGPEVFDLARRIPGLDGVELQVFFKNTTLWDDATREPYLAAAKRTGLKIPSIAGIWPPNASLLQPTAEEHLRKAIHVAESLGAVTILAATFEQNCPDMNKEESYGPVVALLQKVSAAAKDAGVVIGLETSNTPEEDRKLIDLVNRPSIRVYYDLDNVERYQHTNQAVPGIAVLGSRIRQVHLKNETRLLADPGRVNWSAAVKALKRIRYNGWFMFETAHTSQDQCVEATKQNIAFVTHQFSS